MKFTVKEDFDLPIEGGNVLPLEVGDVYEPVGDVEDVFPDTELPVTMPSDDYTPDELVVTAASLGYPQADAAKRITKLFGMTESAALKTVQLYWPMGAKKESIFLKGTSSQETRRIAFNEQSPKNQKI
jgi:hypothetical protein